jgi:hypothetical protein
MEFPAFRPIRGRVLKKAFEVFYKSLKFYVIGKEGVIIEDVIKKLQEIREDTVTELKEGKNELLKFKLDIDRAIKCIEFCSKQNLFSNSKEKYEVIELPLPLTGLFSEYRVVDDCETEDRKYWRELEVKDEKLVLSPGDIIIKKHI